MPQNRSRGKYVSILREAQEPRFADRHKEFEAKTSPKEPATKMAFVVKGLNYISSEGLGFNIIIRGYYMRGHP